MWHHHPGTRGGRSEGGTLTREESNGDTATPRRPPPVRNRLTELLGVDYPIIQAPMGYIARSPLASAVSNAGGLGIIETSSGRLDEVRAEMLAMRDLTDRPWGVNIAQLFLGDEDIVAFVAGLGVRFVTTSAGDPRRFTGPLHDAGVTVFHVVPSVRAAAKAVDAGVDGLVVEGGEGGGFKSTKPVATIVLVPEIRRRFDLPVVAAGGIADGAAMAAVFALGAEGVQMGTRMVSAAESPVHPNYKRLVVDADGTGTVMLSAHGSPAYRVMRTPLTESLELEPVLRMRDKIGIDGVLDLYFNGNLDAGFAFGGQVAGIIDEILPVRQILEETMSGFYATIDRLAALASAARAKP